MLVKTPIVMKKKKNSDICLISNPNFTSNTYLIVVVTIAIVHILIRFLRVNFFIIISRIELKIPLCKGKLTNACGFGGLFKLHSSELKFLFNRVWNKSLKNWGVNQGYLDVASPSTNCMYKIYKNSHVATTLIIEPKLLIKFQPAKASG
jgi:hypothetical protein